MAASLDMRGRHLVAGPADLLPQVAGRKFRRRDGADLTRIKMTAAQAE
jgi:hypothetical protein